MVKLSPALNCPKETIPFENHGSFFPGFVAASPTASRRHRRRVLCFVTRNGVVGASPSFNKAEAFRRAQSAELGELPVPNAPSPDAFLTTLLAVRGFPVRSPDDCVDDKTAAFLMKEFAR